MNINKKTKVKIARYYYHEGFTQTKIAEKLSIPRQTVNKIVKNLVDDGIVRIEIIEGPYFNTELENKLEKKYKLKQVILVDYDDPEEINNLLGKKGANFLESLLNSNTKVGLSWGNTLSSFASNLTKKNYKDVTVVQLVGGSNNLDNSIKADEITRITAEKIGGESCLLYAPSHVQNQKNKEAFLSEENIENVFNEMNDCDMAVVGIGEMSENATLFKGKYLSKVHYEELLAADCVGDICSRYFDSEGKIVNHPINNTVIGIDIEKLKDIPVVIGIAGGENKFKAISGALKGNFLDVLITTTDVAKKLIGEEV
jgi:DNA-binding transcriptional regulator LsrR (DeoR family)